MYILYYLIFPCIAHTHIGIVTHTPHKDNIMIKKLFYSHLGQETIIIALSIVGIASTVLLSTWVLLSTL